jgi:hypothetical protein
MIFDYSKKEKVMVNMIEYIRSILANFPEKNGRLDKSSHGPPVHYEGQVADKAIAGGTGKGFPPHNGPTALAKPQGAAQHPACDCLFDNAGKMSR